MIHSIIIMILINDTDTCILITILSIGYKLIELPTLHIKIISFLGIKCIETVNMFLFGFWFT